MLLMALVLQAAQPLPPPPPGFTLEYVPPACPGNAASCLPWERDWRGAQAQETDYFPIGGSGNGERWSVQVLSFVRARGESFPQLWVRVDYPAGAADHVRRGEFLARVNCAARQIGFSSATRYSASDAVLSHADIPDYQIRYEHVIPGSMNSALVRCACDQSGSTQSK